MINRFASWKLNHETLKNILPLVRPRIETMSDLSEIAGHFLSGIPTYETELLTSGKVEQDTIKQSLQFFVWELEEAREWNKEVIFSIAKNISNFHELKIKDFLVPVFIAITGKKSSTSVIDAMEILGSDMSRARLRYALNLLQISKKQTKKMEKKYQEFNK